MVQVCMHSDIVVASTRYPSHSTHVMYGLSVPSLNVICVWWVRLAIKDIFSNKAPVGRLGSPGYMLAHGHRPRPPLPPDLPGRPGCPPLHRPRRARQTVARPLLLPCLQKYAALRYIILTSSATAWPRATASLSAAARRRTRRTRQEGGLGQRRASDRPAGLRTAAAVQRYGAQYGSNLNHSPRGAETAQEGLQRPQGQGQGCCRWWCTWWR